MHLQSNTTSHLSAVQIKSFVAEKISYIKVSAFASSVCLLCQKGDRTSVLAVPLSHPKEAACECDQSLKSADYSAANVRGEREEGTFCRGAFVLVAI